MICCTEIEKNALFVKFVRSNEMAGCSSYGCSLLYGKPCASIYSLPYNT